jgi:type II secretory ATPase GspE/PulE/Tfp pilus assembly ATPase PilB-like protein
MTQAAPVVKFTDALLERAVRLRASDLLIEPMEKKVRIRYRVDGMFQEGASPTKQLQAAIISRVKIMAELNIAEHRLPQDGHFSIQVDGRGVDFRVSILPSSFGEKVALRVLDKTLIRLNLDQLGFDAKDLVRLKACAQRPHGLILATGPTGSGKTTTLYALLKLIDQPGRNLVTVEDPVEFELEGINQVSARPDVGLNFAAALRSILRQDPDVIMVGEIRDPPTAQIAIQAALTGHLVLSTLHTNDAPGAMTRLLDMGIEPFLITSTVSGVLAQRLVRALCPACRASAIPGPEEAAALRLGEHPTAAVMRAAGCEQCSGIGFKGRSGLFELLVMTERLIPLILERKSISELRAAARADGMRTLREDGIAKVLAGVTTVEEMVRETQDDPADST